MSSTAPDPDCRPPSALRVLKKMHIIRRELMRYSALVEKRFGATTTQLSVLLELHASPHLRAIELQTRLGVHQTTVSNTVDQLARRGFIRKVPDEVDKRAVRLQLTSAGTTFVENYQGPLTLRTGWIEHFRQLPPDCQQRVDEGLADLLEIIESFGEQGYGIGLTAERAGVPPMDS